MKTSKKILSFIGILCLGFQINCTRNFKKGTVSYLNQKRYEIKTPLQAQKFLDNLKYDYEDANVNLETGVPYKYEVDSPKITLKEGKAHCLEGALLAAYLLEDNGYKGKILTMDDFTFGHAIYIYQENGLWGAVGKSRHKSLEGREAKYKTLVELAKSYNNALKNILKEKYKPFIIFNEYSILKLPKNWATKENPFLNANFLNANNYQ